MPEVIMKRAFPKDPVRELAEQLDLEQVVEYDSKSPDQMLNIDIAKIILLELGYTIECNRGCIYVDDYGWPIELSVDNPMIMLVKACPAQDNRNTIETVLRCAKTSFDYFDLVKVCVDDEGGYIVKLVTRNEDALSFRKNIKYYLSQVSQSFAYMQSGDIFPFIDSYETI